MGVIETLELIQIEKHHRERPVVAVRECNRMGQAVIEQFAIGKPRERVVQSARLGFTCMLLRCGKGCRCVGQGDLGFCQLSFQLLQLRNSIVCIDRCRVGCNRLRVLQLRIF